jgi:hypothetical protein
LPQSDANPESFRIIQFANPDPAFWQIGISRAFRSGAGSIFISTKCKAKPYFFPENFNIGTVQNIENCDTYDDDEKYKTKLTGTAVDKCKKVLISNMCKT